VERTPEQGFTADGYIKDQDCFHALRYRTLPASINGCGWVAVYNLRKCLGREEDYHVILRELEGLSYAEIGERLGLEAGTVKSRLFRARKALCDFLRENGNLPDSFPSDKKKSGGEKV
jgi:hypothetical protein